MNKSKQMRQLHKKFLANVPEQYAFMCADGQIFRNLSDLRNGLENMSDEIFFYHSNGKTHDFHNWIRDIIKDEELAGDVAFQVNRKEAAITVTKRIDYLRSMKT